MKTSFYSLSFDTLKKTLIKSGFNPKVANELFNWHYKKGHFKPCELKISKASFDFIYSNYNFDTLPISQLYESKDKTVKFLMSLKSKENTDLTSIGLKVKTENRPGSIESVLIPFQGKYTLCVSSQVGCAMKCSFCYTGTQGLTRHLQTEEIIGQYLSARKWLKENRPNESWISNIVFMGQGEPLHNFESVYEACQIFLSQHGLSIGSQKITISTSGFLPGLKKWKESGLTVNLALSLHSTQKEIRDELIPINKSYPLTEVLEYIDQIPRHSKQFTTYEYLLIAGLNDNTEDAVNLGKLLQEKKALLNLIPFNPYPGSKYKRPNEDRILSFKDTLDQYNIPTMVRITKGDGVLAACGQLNTAPIF